MSLAITAGGTPVAGRFFEDLGYYSIRGTVSSKRAGIKVSVYWYDAGRKVWKRSAAAVTGAGGAYTARQPVGHAAAIKFRTTLGGVPGRTKVISSNEVTVKVANSYVRLKKPAPTTNTLKNPTLSGVVYPARAGVKISIYLVRSGIDPLVASATTDRKGNFKVAFSYGKGKIVSYRVRAAFRAVNRPRTESSTIYGLKRVAVLDPVITRTTAAEVAKTYRPGCPVGPSKLRTIQLNFYGMNDHKVHRGVIIVRSNLTGKITRSFAKALAKKYPIRSMNNPNKYGGKDPVQMEADNSSGFNCRKVVGNPYAQSPHSYGIAVDVNTVENPYRDKNGKWWPKKGKRYIDRTPLKPGMLGLKSTYTAAMRHEGFFWGGLWGYGKDYQHFEYNR